MRAGPPRWALTRISRVSDDWWHSWDDLNVAHCGSHPLLSSRFIRILVKYLGDQSLQGAKLCDGARVMSQTLVRKTGFGRWEVFTPSQAPISPIVFVRGDTSAPAASLLQLLGTLPGARLLMTVPTEDAPYSVFGGAEFPLHKREPLGVTMNVTDPSGFESYWDSRSRDLKKNIRRYLGRVEQEHDGIDFRCVHTSSEIEAAVHRFGLLESSGWKAAEGTALHPGNEQGRLYAEILREFSLTNSARCYELYIGGQLASSRLLISGPSMHVILKTTFREEMKHLAVGRLNLYFVLRDLIGDSEGRTVEFYTRANADTLAWATQSRPMCAVSIYRNSLVSRLAGLKQRIKPQVRKT
jgi:hypothetical protein